MYKYIERTFGERQHSIELDWCWNRFYLGFDWQKGHGNWGFEFTLQLGFLSITYYSWRGKNEF
jgi:hypothetical protein